MDDLGNRIKNQYEDRTRYLLPRRTYTIIRMDGKCFHSFTRNCEKPFDKYLIEAMDSTAKLVCENVQQAKFAYVQSDEISLLLTDFENITTEAWFDGNIQKIASISASFATGFFNQVIKKMYLTNFVPDELAFFDSRTFTIADIEEVKNYFIWRQKDATRNSIQMVAQSLYSHRELMNKNCSQLQEMIFNQGQNWNEYPIGLKRGRIIERTTYEKETAIRHKWEIVEPPIFTQDKDFLNRLIPKL